MKWLGNLQRLKWHQWARVIAGLFLVEQWLDLSPSIPPSEGIVIACIGALFAPVPAAVKGDK